MSGGRVSRIARRVFAASFVMVLAIAGTAFTAPGTACACSCAPLKPEQVVANAAVIVVGTPVSVDEDGSRAVYTVDVVHSYKQAVPERITVDTASTSAACGLYPEIGAQRVMVLGGPVFGAGSGDPGPTAAWTATMCSNLADPAAVIAQAGALIEPLPTADDGPDGLFDLVWVGVVVWAVVGVVVLAVLAGAGWLLVRRVRRTGS